MKTVLDIAGDKSVTERIVQTGKWIRFVDEGATPSGKTHIFRVETVVDFTEGQPGLAILGSVKWFGRWRRYAFHPGAQTVYEETCLREIADFCAHQTATKRAFTIEQEITPDTRSDR